MRIVPFVLLVGLAACSGDPGGRTFRLDFDGEVAYEWILRQVELGPRYPGSPGHAAVQDLLDRSLADLGWEVRLQGFVYRGHPLTNIEAGLGPRRGPLVILGAHYDTRRIADRDPARPGDPVPGANDGASGTAVLLELARVLPTRAIGCDVRLVFFDGEDNGGLDGWEWAAGSRYFAERLAENVSEAPKAVVIVDMVGDSDLRLPVEANSSPDLVDEIWGAAEGLGLTAFSRDPGPSVLDDHTPFLERGWRAVDIIDFSYPHWHTTSDTPDKVSAESLAQVGQALIAWLGLACP